MPKTLVVIRHGKSTWDYEHISDIDRPLKESGIINTLAIAQKLKENNIIPQLILSSHAVRALHTATIVARQLNYSEEYIRINPLIYSAEINDLLQLIKETDDAYKTLFIFGHNPTFTMLANLFLKKQIPELPTSGTVIFDFNCQSWKEISIENKISEVSLFPKSLNITSD
jgi:phosphohistidine phosphatase